MIKAELETDDKPTAQYHFRIIEACERGYYMDETGILYGPKGVIKIKKRGLQRYPTFSTNWGYVQSLPVHKFAAYCYYGLKSFRKGLVVRHLDANTENVSKENLILGTHSENNLDKPKKDRIRAAKAARHSQGETPRNAKLTDNQVRYIRNEYRKIKGKKAPNGFALRICNELGISRTVISNVMKGKSYAGVED